MSEIVKISPSALCLSSQIKCMCHHCSVTLSNITSVVQQFNPGSFRGSVIGKKIQCIFNAAGLISITRATTTETFIFVLTGSISNGECKTLIK